MAAISSKVTIEVDPEGLEVMRRLNETLETFLEREGPVESSYSARELDDGKWYDGHEYKPAALEVLSFSQSVVITAKYEKSDNDLVDFIIETAESLDALIDGLIYAREQTWGPR